MKLGILDFGEIDINSNGIETIHNTISNAQLAEEKGFIRYWLSEHYITGVAWRNSEIILSLIGGFTENIRIGSAGVRIMLNSAFHVAQNYKLLANLFIDRIDLGFANGLDFDDKNEIILDSKSNITFPEKISKVKDLLDDKFEAITLVPISKTNPDLWMLGSSKNMFDYSVQNKMNFSLSLLHGIDKPLPDNNLLTEFKELFYKKNGFIPNTNIAISVFCHDSKERIEEEIATRKNVNLNVFGNAKECRIKIQKILDDYNVDEAIILNLGRTPEERVFLIENLLG